MQDKMADSRSSSFCFLLQLSWKEREHEAWGFISEHTHHTHTHTPCSSDLFINMQPLRHISEKDSSLLARSESKHFAVLFFTGKSL